MAVELVIALALVVANGFFVATEFAVARLRLTEAVEMEAAGRPGARSARHAVEHIDAYLAACQLGITLASIGLGVVGKPVFEELLAPLLGESASVAGFGLAAAAAFGIITVLHVVVGELAPKSLAISRTRTTSLLVAPMLANRTSPVQIAATLRMDDAWLTTRRWAMLNRLTRASARRTSPRHDHRDDRW